MVIEDTMSLNKSWGGYHLFSLKNEHVQVDISDLGATIVNFFVYDKYERKVNIVLGYDKPEEYLKGESFLGAVVGPWANRIKEGKYRLDGQEVELEQNEGTNHLHGAGAALHKKRWQVEAFDKQGITLKTQVKKGEGGYPANLEIYVTYLLTEDNELAITYRATTDQAVPVNLTQHAYFNLNGGKSDIQDHRLSIDADCFWDVDSDFIPQARLAVEGTPMDFRVSKRIGADLHSSFPPLQAAGGYDHCYCMNGSGLRTVARVYEGDTGIALEVVTDQAGLQCYTGNFINNEPGRTGKVYQQHDGFCLEAQCFPDQINMAEDAERCVLRPGDIYRQTTLYQVMLNSNP